jgi:hypothetical protein
MTSLVFTAADFVAAVNLTLDGVEVEGRSDGLNDSERARIIEHLREKGIETQLRQWMIDNPARLPDGSVYALYSGDADEGAKNYVGDMNKSGLKAGRIDESPWGVLAGDEGRARRDDISRISAIINDFAVKELGLGNLSFRGVIIGFRTAQNILFNLGSPSFVRNGKLNGAGYFRSFLGDAARPDSTFAVLELPELAGEELDGKRVPEGAELDDVRPQSKAFAATEAPYRAMYHRAMYRDQLYVDRQQLEPITKSDSFHAEVEFRTNSTKDLALPIDVETKTLEREYVRVNRSKPAKLGEWADYSVARATNTLAALDAVSDRIPPDIKSAFDASTQKFRDYLSKPDGSLDKVRLGAGLATGVLSIANVWVEFARRDYDPDRIAAYLKETAKEAIQSIPIGLAMVGTASLAGPVGWFSLGAVGGYFAIRTLVSNLVASDLLDKEGATYKFVKQIDDALTGFEQIVGGYLQRGQKALVDGAERSLEALTGSAIEWATEEGISWVGDDNDILIGDDVAWLLGNEEDNWLVHRAAGEVFGEAGDDVLIGWLPEEIKKGEIIGVEPGATTGQWVKDEGGVWQWQEQPLGPLSAREARQMEVNAREQWQLDRDNGLDDPDNPKPPPRPITGVVRAEEDFVLQLDGGEGNDWVIAIGGEKAVTAGGLGRDWIFNTSKDGILWGDFASGVDENGNRAEDSSENSDNFWYFPDTVVMDAQRYDVLKFFGIPLTGGDAAASGVSLALGGSLGGLFGAAGTVSAANFAAAATGNAVYFDNLLPFITYKRDGDDLLVGNVFDGFFRAVTGQEGIFSVDNSDGTTSDVGGVMRIRDFAKDGGFVSTIWGFQTADPTLQAFTDEGPAGKFNMVFTPDHVRGGHPAETNDNTWKAAA